MNKKKNRYKNIVELTKRVLDFIGSFKQIFFHSRYSQPDSLTTQLS